MPKDRYPDRHPRGRLRVVTGDGVRAPSPRQAGRAVTIRKEEVTLHGRRVAYRTGGRGPLVVLIHGITSNSATWDRVLAKLATRHTVLAPDLLGHGRSDKLRGDYSLGAHANTVRDLLDALGHQRATFVGHSLGGGVAMQIAYQFPERVDRLALVAPGGFGPEVSLLLRAASLPGSGGALALAAWRPFVQAGTRLARLLGRLGLPGNTDLEEVGRAYALLSDRPTREAFLHTLRAVVDPRGQRISALDRIEVTRRFPLLIVWGEEDRIVPIRHGRQMHELVPNTFLAVFEGSGHFPHRDEPDRFVAALEGFLTRQWRPRRRRAAVGA
jgi:pimeloyl-ACP methyl ester carboxylesterase